MSEGFIGVLEYKINFMNLIFTQIQYLPIQKYAITFFVDICLISDFNISMSFQLFLHWEPGVFLYYHPVSNLQREFIFFRYPQPYTLVGGDGLGT